MSDDIRNKICNYLSCKPVLKAWIFGSFSRGEETQKSDVDILVQFDPQAKVSLIDHIGIPQDLESILTRNVDLVTERSLHPWVKPSVDKDKILIYER